MSSGSGFSGQVVAAIRAEMGWRNLATRDLAAALRISPRAAARRLSGDVDISLNELSVIATWLGIAITDLVEIHRPVAKTAPREHAGYPTVGLPGDERAPHPQHTTRRNHGSLGTAF